MTAGDAISSRFCNGAATRGTIHHGLLVVFVKAAEQASYIYRTVMTSIVSQDRPVVKGEASNFISSILLQYNPVCDSVTPEFEAYRNRGLFISSMLQAVVPSQHPERRLSRVLWFSSLKK
jgi:hypothetical protein